jgi:nucleotide-binding universal stress UspA family protein
MEIGMLEEITLTRILFATDFLESSRLALDYAVAFAQHFRATIVMLHVAELTQAAREVEAETSGPSLMRRAAAERLEVLASGVRRLGLAVETHVEDGIPSEVILSSVDRFHADLLVLGVHGFHRGLEHLLIGSNTEKILLSARCPTLTVGAHVLSGVDPRLHFDKILYVSDFTPEATAAAPYAFFLGDAFDAPIEVCQLLPASAKKNQRLQLELADEYCKSMQAVLRERDAKWCAPAFHLDHGMEVNQLIEVAQRQHAGIIVLGVRTESQLGMHLHTSFAYRLLSRATCPVLSVRPQDTPSTKAAM